MNLGPAGVYPNEDLPHVEGRTLSVWQQTLDRYPKACVWNAFRKDGLVQNRDRFTRDIADVDSWFQSWERRGLITVVDVSEEVRQWPRMSPEPNYLKITITEAGRAALAVWATQYPEAP